MFPSFTGRLFAGLPWIWFGLVPGRQVFIAWWRFLRGPRISSDPGYGVWSATFLYLLGAFCAGYGFGPARRPVGMHSSFSDGCLPQLWIRSARRSGRHILTVWSEAFSCLLYCAVSVCQHTLLSVLLEKSRAYSTAVVIQQRENATDCIHTYVSGVPLNQVICRKLSSSV